MLFYVFQSSAWKELGHYTICNIAYHHLTEATKKEIDGIFEDKPFVKQCTWADTVRKSPEWSHTYNWHFLNLDDEKKYFSLENLEPKGDIIRAILNLMSQLSGSQTTEFKSYLRFLVHLVGDIHQPFHVGEKTNLGGNKIKVSWFGEKKVTYTSLSVMSPDNCEQKSCYFDPDIDEYLKPQVRETLISLHRVWDHHLLERFVVENNHRLNDDLSEIPYVEYSSAIDKLNQDQIREFQNSTVLDWARESICLRKQEIGNGALGEEYYLSQIPILNLALAKAGYRLAFMLNRIFDQKIKNEAQNLAEFEDRLREAIKQIEAGQNINDFSLSTKNCAND